MQRARIAADQRWVDTTIDLVAGLTYMLTAEGEWCDKDMRCGPEGYRSRDYPHRLAAILLLVAIPLRRVRRARWLALVGEVDGPGERTGERG